MKLSVIPWIGNIAVQICIYNLDTVLAIPRVKMLCQRFAYSTCLMIDRKTFRVRLNVWRYT